MQQPPFYSDSEGNLDYHQQPLQPLSPQPNTYYPPQTHYQQPISPPPYPQPPGPPPKKNLSRVPWIILGCLLLLLTIGAISNAAKGTSSATVQSSTPTIAIATATATQPTPTDPPTQGVTTVPTDTPQPTEQPTQALSVTHGTPHLGGSVSDFYGKFGTQIMGDLQSFTDPSGNQASSVA